MSDMSRFKFLAALAAVLGAALRWLYRETGNGAVEARPLPADAITLPASRDVVRIELHGTAGAAESKVGGEPFLPPSIPYPRSPAGAPLAFLAQINFAEVPPMDGYPENGLLSFFFDASHELYGLDLDHPTRQHGFRVLYIPAGEIASGTRRTPPFPSDFSPLGPTTRDVRMLFRKDSESVSSSDYRCPRDSHERRPEGSGHKIGGYPCFVQSDPRELLANAGEAYELLFQLDTDSKEGRFDIMWGDAGIGNFFIKPSALARRDFSDVIYNWDCV
jgi:uncharacterized protein YwqG